MLAATWSNPTGATRKAVARLYMLGLLATRIWRGASTTWWIWIRRFGSCSGSKNGHPWVPRGQAPPLLPSRVHAAAKLGIADLLAGGPRSTAELAEATGTHAVAPSGAAGTGGPGSVRRGGGRPLPPDPARRTPCAGVPGSVPATPSWWASRWCGAHGAASSTASASASPPSTMPSARPVRVPGGPPGGGARLRRGDDGAQRGGDRGRARRLRLLRRRDGGRRRRRRGGAARGDPGGQPAGARRAVRPAARGSRRAPPAQAAGLVPADAATWWRATSSAGSTRRDIYLLKRILHDWDDARARSILRNCRAAVPEAGRLLLVELVVPPGDGPSDAKLLDLLMLVFAGGGSAPRRSTAICSPQPVSN